MTQQLTGTALSPAGKAMNCNQWGTYESPGTASPTQAYCNGGTVDGELWAPCASREECRAAKNQAVLEESRNRLHQIGTPNRSAVTITNPTRAVYPQQTPTAQPYRPAYTPSAPAYGSPLNTPTALPQRPVAPAGAPGVITPNHNNPYLDTPRAAYGGDHSPTYLPAPDEPFMRRLFANMAQGAIEASAHHVSSFLRNVDIFPYRK